MGCSPDNLALIKSDSDASWQQASFSVHSSRPVPSQRFRVLLGSTEKGLGDRVPLMNDISS